jgi:hypothetical protein
LSRQLKWLLLKFTSEKCLHERSTKRKHVWKFNKGFSLTYDASRGETRASQAVICRPPSRGFNPVLGMLWIMTRRGEDFGLYG